MKLILTLMQALDIGVQDCKSRFLRSVRPIYGAESENKKPQAIGSCVLVCLGGRLFGVTAAHIVDALDCISLHVGGAKGSLHLVSIEGQVISTASNYMDFAFWELSPQKVDQLGAAIFIDADTGILKPTASTVGRWNIAMGYRVSKNKKGINLPKKTIQPTITSFTAVAESVPQVLQQEGYSDSRNIVIPYPKFSTNADGAKTNNPPPIGLSGGAIVDFGSASSTQPYIGTSKPLLAGIFTEWHKSLRLAIGVRAHIVCKAIRDQMGIDQ